MIRTSIAVLLLASTLGAQQPTTSPAPGVSSGAVVGRGPNGATLRCKDGTYPPAGAPDSACDGKGGVAVRWPVRRQPPAATTATPQANAATPARTPAPRDTTPPAGFVTAAERRREAEARANAARAPEGATLLCNDGTYVVRDTASVRCASKGGLKLRIVTPRRP